MRIFAFLAGFREFRSDVTRAYADLSLSDAYDRGRDMAHRLTLRIFDR